jgi:hypothetical protein
LRLLQAQKKVEKSIKRLSADLQRPIQARISLTNMFANQLTVSILIIKLLNTVHLMVIAKNMEEIHAACIKMIWLLLRGSINTKKRDII